MSVVVTVVVNGDVDRFRRALDEREGEFVKLAQRGREAGAIHHQFGVGDGQVLVIDEWDTAEHFQAFFGAPELTAFMIDVGADLSTPPVITVVESIASPDRF